MADRVAVLRNLIRRLTHRYRPHIVAGTGGALLGILIGTIAPLRYQAETSFVPESRGAGVGGLLPSGALSSLGINLGSEGTTSPRFYMAALQSRAVLISALTHPRTNGKGTLLDALEPGSGPDRIEKVLPRFRSMVESRVQPESRIVYVTVRGPDPNLDADIANAAIDALRHFDIEMRTGEAKERRAFLEQRTADAQARLSVTEEQMQHFLEQNRATNAPRLRFDEGRLQRQIELQSQVAASLATQLETARVDEVNERPRITVIDRATPPVKPLSRRRLLYMLVGAVVGAAIVTAWQQLVERTADRKPHLTAA